MPDFNNKKELQRFLEIFNYLGSFIDNLPAKKFVNLKNNYKSTIFDNAKPIKLSVDA